MTLTELKISGAESRCQITGGAVVIDGTAYTASDSYFNTLTLTDITLPVKSKGVEVRGTVTSYGSDSENVTVQLIEAGHTEPAYEAIVSGSSAAYSFPIVPAGEYTLKVMKTNHVVRTYDISVGSEAVTQDVKICLLGDINADGRLTLADYGKVLQHVKKVSLLTDYEFACADINKDGKLTLVDYGKILQHVKKVSLLW